jgi:hypothetical protein
VTAELRHLIFDVLEHTNQGVDADRFVLWMAAAVVAVEVAAESNTAIKAAQRDAQLGSDLLERGAHELRQVTMLVRVEV